MKGLVFRDLRLAKSCWWSHPRGGRTQDEPPKPALVKEGQPPVERTWTVTSEPSWFHEHGHFQISVQHKKVRFSTLPKRKRPCRFRGKGVTENLNENGLAREFFMVNIWQLNRGGLIFFCEFVYLGPRWLIWNAVFRWICVLFFHLPVKGVSKGDRPLPRPGDTPPCYKHIWIP